MSLKRFLAFRGAQIGHRIVLHVGELEPQYAFGETAAAARSYLRDSLLHGGGGISPST
jgi:hypothetical protein